MKAADPLRALRLEQGQYSIARRIASFVEDGMMKGGEAAMAVGAKIPGVPT
jgi:hypothetical protein